MNADGGCTVGAFGQPRDGRSAPSAFIGVHRRQNCLTCCSAAGPRRSGRARSGKARNKPMQREPAPREAANRQSSCCWGVGGRITCSRQQPIQREDCWATAAHWQRQVLVGSRPGIGTANNANNAKPGCNAGALVQATGGQRAPFAFFALFAVPVSGLLSGRRMAPIRARAASGSRAARNKAMQRESGGSDVPARGPGARHEGKAWMPARRHGVPGWIGPFCGVAQQGHAT